MIKTSHLNAHLEIGKNMNTCIKLKMDGQW